MVIKQPKWYLYTWTSTYELYRIQIDYFIAKRRCRSNTVASKIWPSADCGTNNELFICNLQVKVKWKNKASQFPQYDLEYTAIFVKENIRNHSEVPNLIYKESEKLWNEIKEIVKDQCEKKLANDQEIEETKDVIAEDKNCHKQKPKSKM